MTVRHFMVAKGGVVVGSRSNEKPYLWAVLHPSAVWPYWFATFHQELARAEYSARSFFSHRGIVEPTTETATRLAVGTRVEEVVH